MSATGYPVSGQKVKVSKDGGKTWRMGEILANDVRFYTIELYTEPSSDFEIDIYDAFDDDTIIKMI